jgi:ribonuclease HI
MTTQKTTQTMKKVTLYCDGSWSKNPGNGGWGCVLIYTKSNGELVEKELVGGSRNTTSNRMEITAAIEGLRAIKYPCQVEAYTDSQYLIKVMSGGKRKANIDLLEQLDQLCQVHQMTWIHVKGHSGNELNERCDKLAKKAALSFLPT